jgi:hypothetical protein
VGPCPRAGDDDRAGDERHDHFGGGSDEEALPVRGPVGPEDDEVGSHVVGELGNLAGGVTAPDVDADAPPRHADERVGFLPEERAEPGRGLLRGIVVGVVGQHVQDVELAAGNARRDARSLVERETAGRRLGELEADEDQEGPVALERVAHGVHLLMVEPYFGIRGFLRVSGQRPRREEVRLGISPDACTRARAR